jgi:hypothetical protein
MPDGGPKMNTRSFDQMISGRPKNELGELSVYPKFLSEMDHADHFAIRGLVACNIAVYTVGKRGGEGNLHK